MRPGVLLGVGIGVFAVGFVGGKVLMANAMLSSRVEPSIDPTTPTRSGLAKGDSHAGSFRDWGRERDLFSRERALEDLLERSTLSHCRQLLEAADPEDERLVGQIIRRWAELDSLDCFAYLTGEGKPCWQFPSAVQELFAVWTKDNPEGAWEAVQSSRYEASPKARDYFGRHLLGNLLFHDPKKAMELVTESRSIGHGLEWRLYGDWSEGDPAGAAELILALPRCNFKSSAARVLAERWGRHDPKKALQFTEGLEPVIRNLAADNVVRGWMASDLTAARAYLGTADSEMKARLGPSIAAELAKKDPVDAMNWVEQNLDAEAWARSQVAVVQAGGAEHPQKSVEIAMEMPAGKYRQEAVASATQQWVEGNHEEARIWLDSLSTGSLREAARLGLQRARIPEKEREALLEGLNGPKLPEE